MKIYFYKNNILQESQESIKMPRKPNCVTPPQFEIVGTSVCHSFTALFQT